MANLVRIRDVHVYTCFGEKVAECWDVMKLLKDNNIPFTQLNWNSDEDFVNANVLAPLNTWSYTEDGVNFDTKTLTAVPVVHWKNVFDDDVTGVNVVQGLAELQNSQLILNQDKVVRPS